MKEERLGMKKICLMVLIGYFCIYFGAYSAFAKERLTLNVPYDEMPSEIQNSDTFLKQLYVQEKKNFDQKISQRKNPNPKVPLYQYKKLAPSAQIQKEGIEIIF